MSSTVNINELLGNEFSKNKSKYEAIAMNMQLVLEIDAFRKSHNISKKAIAEAAGVQASYLSQVYAGDKLFNIPMLAGISQRFNIRFGLELTDLSQTQVQSQVQKFTPFKAAKSIIIPFTDYLNSRQTGKVYSNSSNERVGNGY